MGAMLIFSEGELIVRDDLKYPEGVLVVDGRDARGDLLVRVTYRPEVRVTPARGR